MALGWRKFDLMHAAWAVRSQPARQSSGLDRGPPDRRRRFVRFTELSRPM